MDYPTREKKLYELLEQLYKDGQINVQQLGLSQVDFAHLLEMAEREGFITEIKIIKTKTHAPITWYEDARITERGVERLYPHKKVSPAHNTFNFHNGDFRGSGFGSDITISNNWSTSLKELKDYISQLPQSEQEEGKELVEIIEKQDLRPGALSRFSKFLEEHQHLVEYAGKAIVWALSNPDKLPLL